MRRLLCLMLGAVLLAGLGCGASTDRGINTGKDVPRSADRTE